MKYNTKKDPGELTQIYNEVNNQERKNREQQKNEEQNQRKKHQEFERNEVSFRTGFIDQIQVDRLFIEYEQEKREGKKESPSGIILDNAVGASGASHYPDLEKRFKDIEQLNLQVNQRLTRKFQEAKKYTDNEVKKIIEKLEEAEKKIEALEKLGGLYFVTSISFLLFISTFVNYNYFYTVIKDGIKYVGIKTNDLSGDVANVIYDLYIRMQTKWDQSVEHAKAHFKEAFYGPEKHHDKTHNDNTNCEEVDHDGNVICHGDF